VTFSSDLNLQDLIDNSHLHDDYLWQVSLKSLHLAHRYCITQSRC